MNGATAERMKRNKWLTLIVGGAARCLLWMEMNERENRLRAL